MPVAKPVPIAVPIVSKPPADLLVCAERPKGLPEDAALIAQIPKAVRAGIVRIAKALGANADRLDRLVNWHAAGTCGAAK